MIPTKWCRQQHAYLEDKSPPPKPGAWEGPPCPVLRLQPWGIFLPSYHITSLVTLQYIAQLHYHTNPTQWSQDYRALIGSKCQYLVTFFMIGSVCVNPSIEEFSVHSGSWSRAVHSCLRIKPTDGAGSKLPTIPSELLRQIINSIQVTKGLGCILNGSFWNPYHQEFTNIII